MASTAHHDNSGRSPALDPDADAPDHPGHEFAQFGAGCFWGVELAFQRVAGVMKTEVGYSQGHVPDPTYRLVCSGTSNHVEIVRVQFDPDVCPYTNLLSLFWSRHDPTTPNRQVSILCCFLISRFYGQLTWWSPPHFLLGYTSSVLVSPAISFPLAFWLKQKSFQL